SSVGAPCPVSVVERPRSHRASDLNRPCKQQDRRTWDCGARRSPRRVVIWFMETTGKIAPMTSDMPPESRRPIKARQQVWVHRLAHALVGAGMTPNQMSAASVVAAALGAVAYGGAALGPSPGRAPPLPPP